MCLSGFRNPLPWICQAKQDQENEETDNYKVPGTTLLLCCSLCGCNNSAGTLGAGLAGKEAQSPSECCDNPLPKPCSGVELPAVRLQEKPCAIETGCLGRKHSPGVETSPPKEEEWSRRLSSGQENSILANSCWMLKQFLTSFLLSDPFCGVTVEV